MNQNQRPLTELQKQLRILEEEDKLADKLNDKYKKSLSEELKKFKKEDIKNTSNIEIKYGLWYRIKKTLGII
jgi:uncharacterized protein YgiM (DUF1202 family)